MKARIEKKLSKKIVDIIPNLFAHSWILRDEPTELAENQGTRVSCVHYVGGGVDYWGEGQDAYTAWEWFRINWYWVGNFPQYESGHENEHYPNAEGFNPTTRNLLKLAESIKIQQTAIRPKTTIGETWN